ncbi:unnamed protein product [Blepharisma stoltei]|uniref:Uncharacterized protein n=1 Tax=Blepharisma stoltei TaxID=1481888 RepID=A0AAU9J0B6_9CILI|nr:unnamed protein product [Blepharisma stoltei]
MQKRILKNNKKPDILIRTQQRASTLFASSHNLSDSDEESQNLPNDGIWRKLNEKFEINWPEPIVSSRKLQSNIKTPRQKRVSFSGQIPNNFAQKKDAFSPNFVDMVSRTIVKERLRKNKIILDPSQEDAEICEEKDRIFEMIHRKSPRKLSFNSVGTYDSKSKIQTPQCRASLLIPIQLSSKIKAKSNHCPFMHRTKTINLSPTADYRKNNHTPEGAFTQREKLLNSLI